MKKYLLALNLFFLFGCVSAYIGEQAHTFFMPRPISTYNLLTPLTIEKSPQNRTLRIDHTVFYQSSQDSEEVVPYFLGSNKRTLKIDESEYGDINSDWFHLESAEGSLYQSTVFLAPKRTVWGILFSMHQSLDAIAKGLWTSVSIPLAQVTHNLGLSEVVSENTTLSESATFHSIKEVLDWDNWRKGRLATTSQTMNGCDDIVVRAGVNKNGPFESTQQLYAELVVPVSGHSTSRYLFEPLLGSIGSMGIGGGTKSVLPLWHIAQTVHCSLVNAMQYRYYFSSPQQRLFDLKGQPFSRYLILMDTALTPNVANVSTKAANGVNFLTRDALVTPGATGSSTYALQFSITDHTVQCGYSYWWRTAEQLSLLRASDRSFASPSLKGLIGGSQAWIPSPRITDHFSVNDATATTVTAPLLDIELDMDSAAAPHTASHTFFLHYNGMLRFQFCDITLRANVSYELADDCAALSAWHLWGGIGVQL